MGATFEWVWLLFQFLAQFYWLLDVTWWKITRLLSYLKISHLSLKLHFSAKLLISLTISQVQTLSANIPATWRGFFLNVFSYQSLILCNVSIGEHVINTVTSLKKINSCRMFQSQHMVKFAGSCWKKWT